MTHRPFRVAAALAAAQVLALGSLAAAPALAADAITVRWVEPERYSDAGRGIDRERTLEVLERHLVSLSDRLPAGQRLALEVTDVQLAGELEPYGRALPEVRVMRGRADWPVMELRYTLSDGERTLARGEARLSDPSYMHSGLSTVRSQPLGYEKRMLERWIQEVAAGSLLASSP
jgi:hypothetical protein